MPVRTRSMKKLSMKNNSNNKSKRSMKKVKMSAIGAKPENNVSFAAKLGAFMVENQKLNLVVGSAEKGFDQVVNGKKVNQKVFGVLPFLHLNISKNQFMNMFKRLGPNMLKSVNNMCSAGKLETKLKSVKFNCAKQSKVGSDALIQAVCDSIENRWNMRNNGRAVLTKIQRVQEAQASMGIIPMSSLNWCK